MSEPNTAPAALRAEVARTLVQRGLSRRKQGVQVVPFVQDDPPPNVHLPRGEPRWVARCPECPGAEVVTADATFLCGSCGAEADVDWGDL